MNIWETLEALFNVNLNPPLSIQPECFGQKPNYL